LQITRDARRPGYASAQAGGREFENPHPHGIYVSGGVYVCASGAASGAVSGAASARIMAAANRLYASGAAAAAGTARTRPAPLTAACIVATRRNTTFAASTCGGSSAGRGGGTYAPARDRTATHMHMAMVVIVVVRWVRVLALIYDAMLNARTETLYLLYFVDRFRKTPLCDLC